MRNVIAQLLLFFLAISSFTAPIEYFLAVLESDAVGGWVENEHNIVEIRHIYTYESQENAPIKDYGFQITYKNKNSNSIQIVTLKATNTEYGIWITPDAETDRIEDFRSAASDHHFLAILNNIMVNPLLNKENVKCIVHTGTIGEDYSAEDTFRVTFGDVSGETRTIDFKTSIEIKVATLSQQYARVRPGF